MIVYKKNGDIRLDAHESSDSEVLFKVADEEYANVKFDLISWIAFDEGDYIEVFDSVFTLMNKPAPIDINGSNKYSYTLKFESPRAFLDGVNFELFDDTTLLTIDEFDSKTIYCKNSTVSNGGFVWRYIADVPKLGIIPVEGSSWTKIPQYSSVTPYTVGQYVYSSNQVGLCLVNCTGVAIKEGANWTIVNTAPAFDFSTILSPKDYADLICKNMNRARPNQHWIVGSCIASNPLTQSFSNITCLEALTSISNLFATEHWIDMDGVNFRLNINKLAITTDPVIQLEQGQGNGLVKITKKESTSTKKITRLVALGSENNLYGTYRNGSNRLMLPNRYYIDSTNIDLLNPLEGVVTFDDIMPELHHATEDYNPLTAYLVGSQVLDSTGKSFDCVVSCTGVTPVVGTNWKLSEGTVTEFISQYKFIDSNLSFNPLDPQYIMSDGTVPKVSFLTGNMAGYQFPIIAFDTTTKQITIGQIQDATDSYLPSAVYGMSQFDQYVLVDIYMPQTYIDKAEQRLLAEATDYLAQYSIDQNTYDCPIDQIWATDNSISLKKGQIVHVKNTNLGLDDDYRIITLKRNITQPYKQDIELSNLPYVSSSYAQLKNDVANNSTYLEQSGVSSPMFKARTFRGAQEAIDMAFNPDGDFYTEKIQPLTVQTASLLAGTVTQQFTLSGIKFSSRTNTPNWIGWTSGTVTNTQIESTTRTWNISLGEFIPSANTYYCYLKCAVNIALTSGSMLFTETQYKTKGTDGYYYFLVGTLGSVIDNMRQFYTSYGFTFINGNTITTGKIQGNGASFNLDTGEIKGTIVFSSGENAETAISAAQQAAIDAAAADATAKANLAYANSQSYVNTIKSDLQSQIDGNITSFFYDYEPNLTNVPASSWSPDSVRDMHLGDLFYWTSKGWAYRYQKMSGVYSWTKISDTDVTKALNDAATAQTIANGKRTTFAVQPTTPYLAGDLWLNNGDLFNCNVARSSGEFVSSDWSKGVKYTDDTAVNNLQIGGVNLILNSDFSKNLLGITAYPGSTKYLDANNRVEIENIIGTPRAHFTDISIDANTTYIFQFERWYRDIEQVVWRGNTNEYVSFSEIKRESISFESGVRVYYSINLPSSDYGFIQIEDDASNSQFRIRHPKLERGNKATDYTEAPEDAQAKIDEAKQAADNAQSSANTAVTNAATAQTAANTANTAISNITSDNVLSSAEKSGERTRWNASLTEKSGIDTQATAFGITTEKTAYDNAFQALGTYLNAGTTYASGVPSWLADANLGTNTTIVGATYRTTWELMFSTRQTLLNAIATKAKTLADAAQSTVDNLQIGGRNLLSMLSSNWVQGTLDSGVDLNNGVLTRIRLVGYIEVSPLSLFAVSCLSSISSNLRIGIHQLSSDGTFLNDSDWKSFPYYFRTLSNTARLRIVLSKADSTNILLSELKSIFSIKLEKGNKATDYTEAPEDTQAKITALDYLKLAFGGSTEITGGVVASNVMLLKTLAGIITGGFSGLANDNMGFWTGGTYAEALQSLAKIIFRKDGSWQLAGGKLNGDASGRANLGFFSIFDNLLSASNIAFSNEPLEALSSISGSSGGTLAISSIMQYSGNNTWTNTDGAPEYYMNSTSPIVIANSAYLKFKITMGVGYTPGSSECDFFSGSIVIKNASGTVVSNNSLQGDGDDGDSITYNLLLPAGSYTIETQLTGRCNGTTYPYIGFEAAAGSPTGYFEIVAPASITKIGTDGLYSYLSSAMYFYLKAGFGLEYKGAMNIPGILATGTISLSGVNYNLWGAKKSSSAATHVGTGIYTVPHAVGNQNYTVFITTQPYYANGRYYPIIASVTNKLPTSFSVYLSGDDATMRDAIFDYSIMGSN